MRAWSGGVAERLIAPVLKTGRPKGLVSSNLTPSAPLNGWKIAQANEEFLLGAQGKVEMMTR
jgi:hypothetical protein